MNQRIDLTNPQEAERFRLLDGSVCSSVHSMKYKDLNDMFLKFQNDRLVSSLVRYKELITKTEWLGFIRDNLSEYELYNLRESAQILNDELTQWRKGNILQRFLHKRKYAKHIRLNTRNYFSRGERKLLKIFFSGGFKVEDLSFYNEFVLAKSVFNSLSVKEQKFFDIIRQAALQLNIECREANKELFNYATGKFLFDFEAQNRDVLQYVDNFTEIFSTLSIAISKKQNLTKDLLESLLLRDLTNITCSKRQGEIARIVNSKRKWSVNKFIDKFQFELFRGIRIWLLTPEVASEILPLKTGLFDLVIFDEASQMFVEKGIPAIARARRVVIAGDTKQLRPSNLGVGRIELDEDLNEDEDVNAALEQDSLLDLATYKFVPPVLLNFHYRSKYEELIAFSNYAFYRGRLYVSPNVRSPESRPIEVFKINDGLWVNRSNRSEAQKIIMLLKEFFQKRTNNETIGIITFNSSQRNLIENMIDDECVKDHSFASIVKSEFNRKENGEDVGLFVKNIENVQGDERDVIMFSVGYAKNENGRLVRNFGWLNQKGGENRLNVAITRAKEKVIIVTSFHPSELLVEDAQNDGPRLLKKYLEYAYAISEGDKEQAKQILMSFGDADNTERNLSFDSDFENQVYDALRDRGLNVETQVGIGGYRIDLAIKKDDKYILGIECDGNLYHSSKSARERDYHRQKYLESRGWRIHRIWSTNWWRNPSREVDKITQIVDTLVL